MSGIRLRCRAHNQYTAERTFGAEFMRHKRLDAAEVRAAAKGSFARSGLSPIPPNGNCVERDAAPAT